MREGYSTSSTSGNNVRQNPSRTVSSTYAPLSEPRRRRYARQSITLTAFSAPYLQSCQDIIQDIHRGFASLLPESSLEPWHADRHDDHIAIEMGNRYYLHRGGVPASDIIPFKPCVDPDGVLKRSMGPDFAHTHENEVEYFECDVTSDGITQ